MSDFPDSIPFTSFGISSGRNCPSPSIVTIISKLECIANLKSDCNASPFPKFLACLITSAPAESAISDVLSSEPSSHTTTLSAYF